MELSVPENSDAFLTAPKPAPEPLGVLVGIPSVSIPDAVEALNGEGYEPLAERSVREAVSRLKREPALFVLDLHENKVDEELAFLRSVFPTVPVVVLYTRPAVEAFGTICLLRPVSRESFAAALRAAREYWNETIQRAEREAYRRRAELLEEPIARVIHDLNNQMTGLKGGVDLLAYSVGMLQDLESQQKFGRYLEQFIVPSLGQIENLIFSWRRLRETTAHPARSTDLSVLLREALALCADPAERLRMTFRLNGREIAPSTHPDLGVSGLLVSANPAQTAMALANLLTNALEATAERADGKILVEAEALEADQCVVRVSDNGPGVAEEARMAVWRCFYSTKRQLGLGLPIARQVLDKMQGRIEYVPSELGGAAFEVVLHRPEENVEGGVDQSGGG